MQTNFVLPTGSIIVHFFSVIHNFESITDTTDNEDDLLEETNIIGPCIHLCKSLVYYWINRS